MSEPDTDSQAAPAAETPAPSTATDSQSSRAEAENKLQAYLHLQAILELDNAAAWGEPLWSEAAQATVTGDRLFAERRFPQAAQRYANALQMLEDSSQAVSGAGAG